MNSEAADKWLKQAVNGDSQAFVALLEAHYDMIYRMAFRWCGQAADAEDVTQDVCVKIAQAIRSFRMDSAFSSWVYRIVLNTVRDQQRRQTFHAEVDDDFADSEMSAEQRLQLRQLWNAVRNLPEKQADAVLLVYAQELSHAQAARVMECKESTVSWYIHEARKLLKEELKDYAG
jgi:RNA polymerase sigma-70 factor (ECF subfamily)